MEPDKAQLAQSLPIIGATSPVATSLYNIEIVRRVVPAMTGNIVRLGSSFLLSKYVALLYGTTGVALLGQYTNLNGILTNMSTGSIDNGIVRYVAEGRRDGPDRLASVLSASVQIIAVLASATALGALLFSSRLAQSVFFSRDYSHLVMLMGLMALAQGALAWISGVLNGLGRLGSLGLLNIIAATGSIAVVCASMFRGGIEQTWLLSALALSNLPALGYALWRLRLLQRELVPWSLRRWPTATYTQFARYSIMSGAAAIITPLTALTVRKMLVYDCGLNAAGIYEGVNRLSSAYLSLITTTLAMYYLPKLSAASTGEQRNEMRAMLRLVVPGLLLIAATVWLLRDSLLTLVYSKDFIVSGRLMLIQLVGDCFKMTGWVLAYQMIARGMVGTFVVAETAGNLLRLGTTSLLVPLWGIEGAVVSYAVTCVFYLIGMLWIFRDQFHTSS